MLPKSTACIKSYDGKTNWMYFFKEDDELLETYNEIWNKVNNSIKEELNFEPIYNKKFLKNKTRSYGNEATDFLDNISDHLENSSEESDERQIRVGKLFRAKSIYHLSFKRKDMMYF